MERHGRPCRVAAGRLFTAPLLLFLVGLGAPRPALAAEPFSTDWAASSKSQARLVAAGDRLAGFEIKLAPGAITYWRDPGDAGVPPTFDFGGSENVAKAEVAFPAPKRMKESDGGEAFGYDGDVLFPVRVEPRDPGKPVTLSLNVNYAVCEKVCLPAQAHLKLPLADAASPHASRVAAALAAVPRAVAPEALGRLTSRDGESWRFCLPHETGAPRDLFVEPPAGWWITAGAEPEQQGCFKLALREKPKDAVFPVALRLTLTGGDGPVETTVEAAEPR
jgi:DsbC/DsbD-like thiol-disulfide interchange protein